MLVDDCGNGMGWTSASVRGGWSTPGGCRNSAMSFGGSVPSLHPTGSMRSLRSQHSMQPPPETPRRCIHCHPVHVASTPNNYMQHPMQYYTPTHCMEGQNGTYTPHRGSSYHGDTRLRYIDGDESMGANTNWVLGDLRSLHRCVPALRRTGIDVAGMRTHFYPEGGWGWLVCAAGFLALLLTTGMQLAFGMLYLYAIRHLGDVHLMDIESEYKDQYTAAFLKNGLIRGITYQIKILTWVTWKMLSKKDAEWWLGTEVRDARGFHDLVLRYVNNAADENGKTSDKKYMYRFVQIKHMTCLTGGTKIDLRRLLSTDKEYCQYSLIYLFKSYMHMIDRFEKITPEQIVDMTVFTNRDINTSLKFLVPVKRDEIFDFEEKGKRYRFDLDILRKTPNVIIERLRAMSRNDETRVWSFLSKLVFAVGQPSEPELEKLITKNMGMIFNTPQIFYNDLFKHVMDWFLILEEGNAPYLTEEYIKKHLKKMVDMLLAEKKSDTSFTADSLSLSNLSLT